MLPPALLLLPLAALALLATASPVAPTSSPITALVVAPDAVARITPAAAEGWRFKWKVTAQSDGKGAQSNPSMTVSLLPGKARMDFEGDAKQPGMGKGGYMILDAEKGLMTVVSPEEKKAMVMDPSALGNVMSAMGASGLVKMDVSDVKVAVEPLGAGEKLLGYDTKRFRVTRSHSMSVSVFGRKTTTKDESVSELWMADRFIDGRAFEEWAKSFARGVGGIGGDGFKKLMEAEEANMPKGVPLKQVQKSTSTDDKGNVTTSTITMEMQELKKTSLDASLFEVPAGYEVVDMKAQMAEASAAMEQARADCEKEHGKGSDKCDFSRAAEINMDSIMAASRQGAKDGAKEGAKEAVKGKLKGLIRRKP